MNQTKHYYVYCCMRPCDATSVNFYTRIKHLVSHYFDIQSAINRQKYLENKFGSDKITFVVSATYYRASKYIAQQLELEFDEK